VVRRYFLALSLVLITIFPFFAVGADAATPARATVGGQVPAWANSANYRGKANGAQNIAFRVYLNWQNQAAVEALAQAVSDPKSASYGHYLSPPAFRQAFAPSAASLASVQDWLRGQGFSVLYSPANNQYVLAVGTVDQAAAAFGTTFGMYRTEGKDLRSPSSDISVPGSIRSVVRGVIGLDDSGQLIHHNGSVGPDASPSPAFVNATPCSTYWAEKTDPEVTNPYATGPLPYAPCGYTPQQIRGAYGVSDTYQGDGQTVVIIDAYASPTIQADLDQWSANRGLASTTITQYVPPFVYNIPETANLDPQGWYGEETLDVEAVHGMAPAAHIVFIGTPNPAGTLDMALNQAVDNHYGSIITNSYGYDTEDLPGALIGIEEDIILQGVAEGIGIYFSSGDNGDNSIVPGGPPSVDWPASSPFVTAVGGTSLAVGSANDYLFETGWGTTKSTWTDGAWSPAAPGAWIYGGGGGVSQVFPEPNYQKGVVPRSIFRTQGRTGRTVPDISADGDPGTGYLIGQTQAFPDGSISYSEYRIGGTSLSSPLIAGIMALADQANGSPHGFVNPLLYQRIPSSDAVNDVVQPASTVAVVRSDFVNGVDDADGITYSLRTMNQTLSLSAQPGYDDVTGLGSPAASFIRTLVVAPSR
jgi:subtilase family serine protease